MTFWYFVSVIGNVTLQNFRLIFLIETDIQSVLINSDKSR